jgi:glycosyltransferase involved in cell wall biosynthesis
VRILFVTHSFPRWSGDVAGAFILRLARALAATGTQVHVLAPAAKGLAPRDTVEGVTVHRFSYAPAEWQTLAYTGTMAEQVGRSWQARIALSGMLARGAMAVYRDVATLAPHVVHAHWWFPGAVLALGAPAAVPAVTTLHGSDVRLARGRGWASALFRRIIARSAAVTAVSTFLADEARAMAPELKATVEPMPVNVELFTPGGERQRARFLFVGRLNAQKGVDLLLEALAMSASGAALDVVGNGPDRAAIETRAARLGIASRLTFHGERSQEQLAPLYRAATAVVIPSEREGLGLVAVEALLCETPVIAFRSGGLTDVVTDGETGYLTPPGDVRALSAAMDALLARADRGTALGRAGRVTALGRFSPDVVAARYRTIYERVVSHAA